MITLEVHATRWIVIMVPKETKCEPQSTVQTEPKVTDKQYEKFMNRSKRNQKGESRDTLATEAAGELQVLGLDSDTLSMDGSEVSILEEGDEVSLSSFLEGHNSRRLEAKIGLVVLSNFTDETLEGQLANEELSALLVATDFTEGDGTRAEAVRLLDATGRRGRLARLLGRELLAWSLATSRLASGLLGTGHLSC